MCVPQSARISSPPLKPTRNFFDNFITGALKLRKYFLSGNPSKMPVKCQYKFLTRLIVAVHVIYKHPNARKITHLLQNKFCFVAVNERRFKFIGEQPIIQGDLKSGDS